MKSNRYIAQHEFGSDWQVWDTKTNRPVATGLNSDEAEQNANDRNETEDREKKDFI
jgi:hypothetical protein